MMWVEVSVQHQCRFLRQCKLSSQCKNAFMDTVLRQTLMCQLQVFDIVQRTHFTFYRLKNDGFTCLLMVPIVAYFLLRLHFVTLSPLRNPYDVDT